jgi:hypothetical protein
MTPFATEDSHSALERRFADAILFDDVPIPATIQLASGPATASRFGVYRNNVLFGLMNALAARFPVTRRILWPDTFDGAARLFVTMHPPRSPLLLHYGDGFPQFLRSIGTGPSADYAADIAELESARVRAYHAPDALPLPGEAFGGLSPDSLTDLRFALHPSVSLVSSRFPIASAWEASMHGGNIDRWTAETALIVRPHLDVQVWRLPPGGCAFFRAIGAGRTAGEAATGAMTSAPQCDLAQIFHVMICSGAVTEMLEPAPPNLPR